jgi:predicted transcriptional regulator
VELTIWDRFRRVVGSRYLRAALPDTHALGIHYGITMSMKTAISVEDSLMEQADKAARDLGLSRSGLIAAALRDYLLHRSRSQVTEQLNRAYANEPSTDERRLVRRLKTKLPSKDRW